MGVAGNHTSRLAAPAFRRSDRNRTCLFTVPNRARHLDRHAPIVDPAGVAPAPARLKGECSLLSYESVCVDVASTRYSKPRHQRVPLTCRRSVGDRTRTVRVRAGCSSIELRIRVVVPLGIEPRPPHFQSGAQTIYARARCAGHGGPASSSAIHFSPGIRGAGTSSGPRARTWNRRFQKPQHYHCASPDQQKRKRPLLRVARPLVRSLGSTTGGPPSAAG